MPDRILRAAILTSDAVNTLSIAAEVFYRRLMSVADDYGRYDGRPAVLRAALYALRLTNVSEPDVVKLLDECSRAGLVRGYVVDGRPFVEILKFGQRVRSSSKWPEPVEQTANSPPRTSADNCCQLRQSVGSPEYASAYVHSNTNGEGRDAREGGFPTLAQAKLNAQFIMQPEADAEAFWNHFEASGWIDKNGNRITNWKAKQARWKATTQAEAHQQRNGSGRPLSVMDLKTILSAKEEQAAKLKLRHCSETASGNVWDDEKARLEFCEMRKEIKTVKERLAKMA